jgi:hypothetical protein
VVNVERCLFFSNLRANFKETVCVSNAEIRKKVKKYIDEADDHVMKVIYSMFEAERKQNDWWEELPASVRRSIIKAENELKAGKGIPHEVVMKKYKKWLQGNMVISGSSNL